MGADCSTCCTTADESKQELNDDQPKPSYQYKTIKTVPSTENDQHINFVQKNQNQRLLDVQQQTKKTKVKDDMEMLVRLQAVVRGYLQRRKYRIQKIASDMASKYFKAEEALETLTGKYKRDAALK